MLNSNGMTAYQIALANFRSGAYGTPTEQRRGASHRAAFWDGYNGLVRKHVPGSICAAHARAGRTARKEAT